MTIAEAARLTMAAFLLSLSAIVAIQLLTGSINTRYLLYGRRRTGELYFSPGRVQLLVITLGFAFNYLMSVVDNRHAQSLPEVPLQALTLLGASHLIYLGGKAYSRFGA